MPHANTHISLSNIQVPRVRQAHTHRCCTEGGEEVEERRRRRMREEEEEEEQEEEEQEEEEGGGGGAGGASRPDSVKQSLASRTQGLVLLVFL